MDRRSFLKTLPLFCFSLAGSKLLVSCQSSPSSGLESLQFGILSTEDEANQKPLWEPFLAAMSQALGITVTPFYTDQYSNLIEAMRFEQIQIAWYGGKAYVEAAQVAGAEAFALTLARDGSKGYYAHLIVRKDSPFIDQAKSLGGDRYVLENATQLTFAFNDPNSTSGFLVPSYYIFAKNNLNPQKAFKKLLFAGDHEAAALAVANGSVDIATNNSEALVRLAKSYPDAYQAIETIWTSVLIPGDPIAYHRNLPQPLKQKIQQFFYTYDDEAVLNPLDWSGFEAATDEDWNPVRELNIGKQMLDIEANENINPADKNKMLEELQQKLDALS